jgi:hypothetical protein
MEEESIDFEEYCTNVLNIIDCNLLNRKELDECYRKYINYLDKIFEHENGRCCHCGNYLDECGCDR